MTRLSRLQGLGSVAFALLGHERARTALSILGVALAVLAAVLLASVGLGVVETGEAKLAQSGRDLWVTGGPVELRPGAAGGFQNALVGAHEVAASIEARDDVANAVPMAFQSVYASRNGSDFRTVVGAGAPAYGPSVSIAAGRPFQEQDPHYADGSYDGPMAREAVLDRRAADLLGVSVNDTIHVGGTVATARQQEFRVVGISSTFSRYVGAPTVTLHLSELQTVTGTTASDRGTFVTIRVADGADPATVEGRLEAAYPEYTVRTNSEQLRATLADRALLLVSGASLLVLGAVAGVLLVVNLQLSVLAQHRRTFGALLAGGTSHRSLVVIAFVHTLVVGTLGGALGVGLAVPGVRAVNAVTASLTGFEGVAVLSGDVLLGGLAVAVGVSLLAGAGAGLYLARIRALEQLR